MARLRVGTSGWNYPHWRERFYPHGLASRRWLGHYAAHFDTVELNRSFYRLPTPENFAAWAAEVPAGFLFAVKASRYTTHVKRLKEAADSVANLLEAARFLGESLGPVLFQLPPNMHYSADRLQGLLDYLGTQEIVPGLRAVLEVRHPGWLNDDCFGRLERAGVALCLADHHEVRVEGPVTAGFVYVRRHGPTGTYAASYPEEALAGDARLVKGWLSEGRDVYVYFNNDQDAWAVANARRLLELTGRAPGGG